MVHDARAPEKTVLHLPPLVPSQPARIGPASTRVQQPGVPEGAAEENPSHVACMNPQRAQEAEALNSARPYSPDWRAHPGQED
jgi:hypothetical protein